MGEACRCNWGECECDEFVIEKGYVTECLDNIYVVVNNKDHWIGKSNIKNPRPEWDNKIIVCKKFAKEKGWV